MSGLSNLSTPITSSTTFYTYTPLFLHFFYIFYTARLGLVLSFNLYENKHERNKESNESKLRKEKIKLIKPIILLFN